MGSKTSIVLLIGWMSCIAGCSDADNSVAPESGRVFEEFQLLNSRGEPFNSFGQTDTIVFVYRLSNQAAKDLVIGMAHGGPFVQFIILDDTMTVQDSFGGYAFPSTAPSYPFRRNQIVEERWTLAAGSLLPQTYTAVARPQMVVAGSSMPERSYSFRVR